MIGYVFVGGKFPFCRGVWVLMVVRQCVMCAYKIYYNRIDNDSLSFSMFSFSLFSFSFFFSLLCPQERAAHGLAATDRLTSF